MILGFEAGVFWIAFMSMLYGLADSKRMDQLGLFSYALGTPLFMIAICGLAKYKEYLTYRDLPKNYKKDVDIEHYLNVVINLINNRGTLSYFYMNP